MRSLEVYHPYVAGVIVSALLVGKAIEIPGVDKFFTIGYQTTRNNQVHYSRGYDDIYPVAGILCVITIIRFLYTTVVLKPIAHKLKMSVGLTAKFIESGWFSLYHLVVTVWGYFLFRDDIWWYNDRYFWDGYPYPIDFDMKTFYFVSLAFWLQSLLSFSFEPPRKDGKSLLFHHLLTIYMIMASYLTGLVRYGAAILMLHGCADILFYHSKVFNYTKLEKLASFGWVSFVFVWFYTRHVVFGYLIYSMWTAHQYIPPVWDTEKGIYFSEFAVNFYIASVMSLQLLNIFWFTMILKVLVKVIMGTGEMKDSESEYSDDEVERLKLGKKANKHA
jgi:acyl-CoA-dependent ceramide synthase